MSGLSFFLGTGNPSWLKQAGVPLFVSDTRLRRYKTLPRAIAPWSLDSGGFTQLQKYGCWTFTPTEYVERVRKYRDKIHMLKWAAPMDEMCEPAIIHGGEFGGQHFVGTRQLLDPSYALTDTELVRTHQHRTVTNFVLLRKVAPDLPIVPVIQGYSEPEYVRCINLYRDAGIDLTREPLVGLGSVCRRQNTTEIHRIVTAVRTQGVTRLHGFGVKTLGLRRYGHLLTSADSQAWSRHLRYKGQPVCGQPHPRSAKNCANCLPAALAWRQNLLTAWGNTDNRNLLDLSMQL